MPYVEATGAKLYFEESGYGYPIIFIHEFASDIRGWEAQFQHFSLGYRCIAYNARGYPPSDVPEDAASYGWELAVDDIAAVMRGLSIERAHLVGLSMGGYAALQFGLRHPQKVSAIVAASVGSGSHPSQRDAWLRETSVLARIFIDHGMVAMAERMARGPDPHPAETQGSEQLAGIRCPSASAFAAGHVAHDGALSGLAAVAA